VRAENLGDADSNPDPLLLPAIGRLFSLAKGAENRPYAQPASPHLRERSLADLPVRRVIHTKHGINSDRPPAACGLRRTAARLVDALRGG